MKNPKAEFRNPKETRNPKAETDHRAASGFSDFGFRNSFGLRISVFGFHVFQTTPDL